MAAVGWGLYSAGSWVASNIGTVAATAAGKNINQTKPPQKIYRMMMQDVNWHKMLLLYN